MVRDNLNKNRRRGCVITHDMMPSEGPQIVRPTPRRPFNHNDKLSMPPSPLLSPSIANQPDSPSASVSRSHSVLNLTSSTLLGIYSRTGLSSDREEQSTPWGTGSETPISDKPFTLYRRRSIAHPAPPSTRAVIFSLALRSVLLFCLGMLYGLLVRHLHDDGQLAPFQVEGILKPSYDWRYFVFWGVAGVALGSLLPWVDTFWEENAGASENLGSEQGRTASPDKEKDNYTGILGADWTPVIRSVGAFVGIAYAIVSLYTFSFSRMWLSITAETSMGLDPSSFTDTCTCQSCTLVHN